MMISNVFETLEKIQPLSDAVKNAIDEIVEYKEYAKDEIILKPGQVSKHTQFIVKGIAKGYFVHNDMEVNTRFMSEGDTMTSLVSFFQQVPSQEYMQATEDMITYRITFDDLTEIYNKHIDFNILVRKFIELYIIKTDSYRKLNYYTTPEEKYKLFLKNESHLVNRISVKDIASFLNISRETLSRIRNRQRVAVY